mmetsp:Transcript_23497/g.39367  ORF Transcript_23497/g.39367 Transcript_23497/m.39367 type:complete len:550 (+) Transcript_23497:243-1892(+)
MASKVRAVFFMLWAFGGTLTPSAAWFFGRLGDHPIQQVAAPPDSNGTDVEGAHGDDQPVSSGDPEWDESDLDSLGLKFMLNSTLDAGSTQIKSPGAFQIPRPPQLSIPLQVDDTNHVVPHEDANKTAVGNKHIANSVETNRTVLNLETNQPPPPVNSTLSHSPIIPFRIDANLETVVPQDMKFKTAFELYDPARATSLSRGFQKFCRYRHLHPSKEVPVPEGQPDFVLGLASGYAIGQVAGFVVSLRAVGYNGSIVLGVDGGTMRSRAGIPLKRLFTKYTVKFVDLGNMQLKQYAQVCRYVVYKEWIEKLVPENGRVLISDVRDVYFQANPFEAPVPDQSAVLKSISAPGGANLLVFEETRGPHNHMNLNSQKLNRRWITEAYSGDPLGLRGNLNFWVLCSGTTMGTKPGMAEYALKMTAEMGLCRQRHPVKILKGGKMLTDVCISGADQAFHNVLFYRGQLTGARSVPNGQGQMYTVGIFPKIGVELKQDEEGYILNVEGQRVPAVHQSDKFPQALDFLHRKYLRHDIARKTFMMAMTGGARYSVGKG